MKRQSELMKSQKETRNQEEETKVEKRRWRAPSSSELITVWTIDFFQYELFKNAIRHEEEVKKIIQIQRKEVVKKEADELLEKGE